MGAESLQRKALIFGVTGQCGSYLADLLLSKGYRVFGVVRRTSTSNLWRIEDAMKDPNFSIVNADITDYPSVFNVLLTSLPDEVYNMAAQSFVGVSFQEPNLTFEVTATGCLNILECIRMIRSQHKWWNPRFYQASSSEQFGSSFSQRLVLSSPIDSALTTEIYQSEKTVMTPQSPYAIAKLAAYNFTLLYRKYDIYAATGILFNNESPRRGDEFVTQKIAKYVASYSLGRETEKLKLGNLMAKRDWGYSLDYMEGVWRILQQPKPGEYVLATGETHTVLEFVAEAFHHIGVEDYMACIEEDPQFKRPAEVPFLKGCADRAKLMLKWEPRVQFVELVKIMVDAQIQKQSK